VEEIDQDSVVLLDYIPRRMTMIPKDIEHEPKASAQAMITTTLINKERHEIGVEAGISTIWVPDQE
jgi:hypothetical protein